MLQFYGISHINKQTVGLDGHLFQQPIENQHDICLLYNCRGRRTELYLIT